MEDTRVCSRNCKECKGCSFDMTPPKNCAILKKIRTFQINLTFLHFKNWLTALLIQLHLHSWRPCRKIGNEKRLKIS